MQPYRHWSFTHLNQAHGIEKTGTAIDADQVGTPRAAAGRIPSVLTARDRVQTNAGPALLHLLNTVSRVRALFVGLVAVCMSVTTPALGQLNEDFKVSPGDGVADQEFGYAVAADNGMVAVGARIDDDNGADSGSLYLFDAITGALIDKLVPSDLEAGAAYLYYAHSGTQIDKLLASDSAVFDRLGGSIAMAGGLLAVDAIGDNGSAGAVYLYGSSPADSDGDGVDDTTDNCTLIANPAQQDANGDQVGNVCDADVTGPGGVQDCIVNFLDLLEFKNGFFGRDPELNLDGVSVVNFADLAIVKSQFS